MTRSLLAAALLVLPLSVPWALGNPEAGDFQPARGKENWDQTLDISGRKAGKYNLIVRATDEAGNVRYGGPYNVFMDPASDLPVAHISCPTVGARVGSLLYAVGTARDDDGVQEVEVRLDDGEFSPAEGTDFWSYSLDTEALADGEHTLSARGVDVTGTQGPEQKVRFNLDKKAPSIRIVSHASGTLVAGQVELKGQVEDSNGLASLEISYDGGQHYAPLKMDLDKPGRQGQFRVDLDTRKDADGPKVLWFRAADRTGSRSQYAFLLFVNNQAPVLEVLYPQEDAAVHGKLLVVGRASDRVGLRSLTYDLGGGERGSLELIPGNPFWTHPIDLKARKAGPLQITYTLENLAGNRESRKLRVRLDPEADKPRLELTTPPRAARVSAPVWVCGFAQDSDGVQRVEYTLDGGQPVAVPAEAAFAFQLPDLPPGAHKLSVKAVDIEGTAGNPVELTFVLEGPPPIITMENLTIGTAASAFLPGALLPQDKDARLTGTIHGGGTSLVAQYSLAGAAPKALSLKKGGAENERTFELPLPKGLAAGRIDLVVRAKEGQASTEYRSFLFKGSEQGGPELLLSDSRLGEDGTIRLDERPLIGYLVGGTIRQATLDPATPLLRLEFEGQHLRVTAAGAGATEKTRIRVISAEGGEFTSDELRFITDMQPPQISVLSPAPGAWLNQELKLVGQVQDSSGLAALEYSIDGGSAASLAAKAGGSGWSFAAAVALDQAAEGPHRLELRATDAAGNVAVLQVPFQRDSTAPVLSFLAPRPEDEVNGLISLAGRVEEAGKLARVEVSEDGESFREIGTDNSFRVDVNLSKLPAEAAKLQFRTTDAAGNSNVSRPQLALSLAADRPTVQIQLPADGELERNDFALSGMAFDDDGIRSISWRLDAGEFQEVPGGNAFSVPIALDGIADNKHTVEVKAEDLGGLQSEVARSTFRVSKSDPRSALLSPRLGEQLRDVVQLKGISQDPNGIKEVMLSFDNGLSFFRAEGAEQWSYRLDTRLLSDGIHAILVRAVDNTGAEGLFTTTISIDNRAPELALDEPRDGQIVTDRMTLNGRSSDNIALASLSLSVTPISASPGVAAKGLEKTLEARGILSQEVELTGLAAGWYNVRLEAADRASNRSFVSRNVRRQESAEAERVELFFPSDGESLAGLFTLSGRVVSRDLPQNIVVLVDEQPLDPVPLNAQGYFRLDLGPEKLSAGEHKLKVEAVPAEGVRLSSATHAIRYLAAGPWVRITSAATGDYLTGRPFLRGEAGYCEEAGSLDAEAQPAARQARKSHAVRLVEVSLDNGTSYHKAEGKDSWRWRVETQELANGPLRLLVRASFESGEIAVARTMLIVDTLAPQVSLLEPSEGGRFNESIRVSGTAADESGLKEVAVGLREGDKSRYQVPAFIQGLYLDMHAMGATYWDLGLGLTFFDDNVKLQVQVGMSPPGRFSGLVLGAKLLANIATLPFGYFFGPSWDFFSMSLAVGATFAYFTMSQDSIAFTDQGMVLGGVVAQIELARLQIPRWRAFSSYALYSEYQLWFISSDVQAGTESRVAFGLRVGLL